MKTLTKILGVGGLVAALGSGCDTNYEHNAVKTVETVKVKLPDSCSSLSAPDVIGDYWKSNADKVICLEEQGSIILTVEKPNPYFF